MIPLFKVFMSGNVEKALIKTLKSGYIIHNEDSEVVGKLTSGTMSPVLKKGIIYFDSSCMTLRPKQVISKMDEYYNDYPACAGRSVHKLSLKVGEETTDSRKSVQKLVNARKPHEIIFTRNTTEAINLVSNSFKFEKVLISDREHNSNLLPWQKFKYGVLRSKEDFSFDLEKF